MKARFRPGIPRKARLANRAFRGTYIGAGRNIMRFFTGNSYAPRFNSVLVLTMTSFLCDKVPVVQLDESDDIAYLHWMGN